MHSTKQENTQWQEFAAEIDLLKSQCRENTSIEDYQHLQKMANWGRISSVFGYMTAWILPNPVSAFLISQGNYTRWALVLHPISHGAMDAIPGLPHHVHSRRFARGWRRFIDWPDWIKPEHWHVEHDQLHHFHLGTDKDPDVVWRNAEKIRTLPVPHWIRYLLALIMACVWKPLYYAPNTLMEFRHHRKLESTNHITWNTWNPFRPAGKELWFGCLLPYSIMRFLVIPLLFLPLGAWAVACVCLNSILAELFTNIHSFATIGPNHTGDDVYTFRTQSKSRAEFYLHQIVGSVNFKSKNQFQDFLFGGLNYQIEHHVFPSASLLQCQKISPQLKAICAKYNVPYIEANLLPRIHLTLKTMSGRCAPKEFHQNFYSERK